MKNKLLFKSMLLLALAGIAITGYASEKDEQRISIESMEQNTAVINVENITDSDTAYYVLFDTLTSQESDKIPSDNTGRVSYDVPNGTTLQIASYNQNDSQIYKSSKITIYTHDTSLNSITLKNDIYIKTLINTSGDIRLSSYTLHVLGDAQLTGNIYLENGTFEVDGTLVHSSGTLAVESGELNVKKDYRIEGSFNGGVSSGKLRMKQSGGTVNVGGDFVTDSLYAHTGDLTDGVFTLDGNFSQINSTGKFLMSRYNFDTSDNFKIVFNGTSTQTVYFYDSRRSQFSIWEITNQSEVPINITNGFGLGTLHQDSIIYGDIELLYHIYQDGTTTSSIDLNGYTLTIMGNVQNNRVNILISKGKLMIYGDYTLQVPRDIGGGKEALRWSNGTLRMLNNEDYVLVTGDFRQDSYYSHSGSLVAGTLEIKGNFYQSSSNSDHDAHYNFDANGTHKVILSGDGVQMVEFDDSETSGFNILEISDSGTPGHIIIFRSPWRANELIISSTTAALFNWYE